MRIMTGNPTMSDGRVFVRPALPPNLKQLAAAHVREEIFSGRLKPGAKIDQDGIAARLGISKLPVREALISLEHEGLVENPARRGAYVARLTRDDILDHYRLIALVSGLAAQRAAAHLDAEEIESLALVLDELDGTDDPRRQEELNAIFHRAINVSAGSLRLRSALRVLNQTMPANFYEFAEGWNENAKAQHRRILDALRTADADAAEAAVVDHITAGGQYAVRRLDEVGFWD